MKIGFIGLGIMGKPMAKNLVKAGHELRVFDRTKSHADEVVAFSNGKAVAAASAVDAAKGVELVLTMLPNSPHVKSVMLIDDKVAEHMEKGAAFIDMSSINPIASREIAESLSLNSGGGLTEILRGLQASNFIIQYTDFGGSKREVYYKLSDLFSLFYLYFSEFHKVNSPTFWADNLNSPQLNAWRGLAFEQVCFVHQKQIKRALGISGVNTNIMPWRNSGENGVQIDMVIDRDDRVVNICEMKFSSGEFSIDRDYDMKLRRKVQIFTEKLKVRKNPHLTVITTFGLQKNEYSGHIQKCITADDLFKE